MSRKIWADVELVTSDTCTSGDDVQRQFRESLLPGKKRFVSFFRFVGYGFAGYLIIASSYFSFFFFFFLMFHQVQCLFFVFFFNVPSTTKGPLFFYPSVNRQLFPDLLFVGWLSVALRPQ